jgi:intracellular septation protein A
MSLTWWRYKTRRFLIDSAEYSVSVVGRLNGLHSSLMCAGKVLAQDHTPISGKEATRNHLLVTALPDGRQIEVETGYITIWTMGIAARIDGNLVHESHPGKSLAYPEKYKAQTEVDWRETGAFAPRNRLPFAVDILTGLLFFIVAKLTDLTTAALVGAVVGIGLVVFQRMTRIDVTGGLALFGIVMLLISAGLAFAFQDDDMVKLRGTITGCIAATLFLGDGLLGGKRLAGALVRYMPFSDIEPGRLGIGLGLLGLFMAALNFVVAKLASTDVWLFYSTFVDFIIVVILAQIVIARARRQPGARGDGG